MLLSHKEIVERVQRDFIPTVGQHEILANGTLRDWWTPIVSRANPQYRGASTQGFYVVSGDGTGLAWDDYNQADATQRFLSLLDRGMQRFRQQQPRQPNLSQDVTRAIAPITPPAGASVVRLFTRIRPLPAGADPTNALLGRDYMWILKDEVRDMLAASERSDQPFAMPRTLVARLVIFHMVDNVRGQVWTWQPQAISRADFNARRVRQTGNIRTFSFSGDFAKKDSHPPQWTDRGHEGRIEGEFDVDTATAKIVRFRAFADSHAWSDAAYSPFHAPSGQYPIITAIVEATDALAQTVPPEPARMGGGYLRPQLR